MYWCDWDEGVVPVAVYILDVKDRQQFYRCQVEYNVPACHRPGGSQTEPCVHTLKSDLPLCLMGCSVVHVNMLEPLEVASQYGEMHSRRVSFGVQCFDFIFLIPRRNWEPSVLLLPLVTSALGALHFVPPHKRTVVSQVWPVKSSVLTAKPQLPQRGRHYEKSLNSMCWLPALLVNQGGTVQSCHVKGVNALYLHRNIKNALTMQRGFCFVEKGQRGFAKTLGVKETVSQTVLRENTNPQNRKQTVRPRPRDRCIQRHKELVGLHESQASTPPRLAHHPGQTVSDTTL